MSQVHLPAEVRQRYSTLADNELRALLRQTLEAPGKQTDNILKHWLVALSFQEIRPPEKSNVTNTQRRQWVAFALRYLEPLVSGSIDPNTRASVLDELNNASGEKIAALLFGPVENAEITLKAFFHKSKGSTAEAPTEWQQQVIKALRCNTYSDDVIKTWSRAVIEPLISAAVNQLQPVDSMVRQGSVPPFNKKDKNASSEQFTAVFENYLTLTEAPEKQQYYGQALDYRNEYKRRLQVIAIYSRTAWRSIFAAIPLMVGLSFLVIDQPHRWLIPLSAGVIVIIVFYGRLTNYLLDTFTWARTAQETLATLIGNADDSQ